MADPVSEDTMIQRRNELQKDLDDLNEKRIGIEREIIAIGLYLDAMKGVLPTPEPVVSVQPQPDKPKDGSGRSRGPRGQRKGAILEILRKEPEGYTFNQIAEMLEVADSQEKKTVYAALHNMKRKGEITQKPDKRFVVPPAEEQEPQQPQPDSEAD
jgi:predicted Zn-ribbon and HTH transcriptional regulator